GGDTVRPGNDRPYFAGLQEMAHHVVGDERERDAAAVELPGRKPRTLEIRPRFRHKDVQFAALLEGYANHAERSADAGGGERARIALGHHLALFGHEFRSE